MSRPSSLDRSQVIFMSGLVSGVLAVLLLLLAYAPW